MTDRVLLSDQVDVERDGEVITVWNSVTVSQHHDVSHSEIRSSHTIRVGDGSLDESPDYITPQIDDQLRSLNVYPNAEVVDPLDDGVTIL